jgi:hypothetical protein
MMPKKIRCSHFAIQIAAAALVSVCWLQPISIAQATDDAEAAARQDWREVMAHNPASPEGCFQASYPNIVWEQVECKELHPRVRPVFHKPTGDEQVTGNGHDYVAEAAGLISETVGTFPKVTGVTSEKSVGVPLFGDGGILGPNEYTLQINSDFQGTTAACHGHTGCVVWQQFIYSPDYEVKGKAAVFMQYWLIGWGSSACPSSWGSDGGGDCYKNSAYIAAPDMKIASLSKLSISGAAAAGGNDTVVFNNGTKAYSVSGPDTVLDISQVWKESEFNIVGNAGGSRAVFNKGSSVTVKATVTDGSTSAPTCVANAGSTGETNNLNLGTCSTAGGSSPYIEFTESN